MVQSLSFSNADGRDEKTPPSMQLVVRGFTEELNSLSSTMSSAGKRQSAGDIFLSNLLRSPLFRRSPRKGVESKIERQGGLPDNDNLFEISLTVYLSRPLGVFSPAWVPAPGRPAAEEEGEGETAAADEPDEEADE